MRVVLSSDADRDIDELYLWIGTDSIQSADRVLDDIIDFCFDALPLNPGMGRPYNAEIRVFPKRGYRIFYRINGETIEIVRVLHAAWDADPLLGK